MVESAVTTLVAPDPRIHQRLFLVGCSRSGTTLLQGMLASHPRVRTFPETGVLLRALGMRHRTMPLARLGLSLGKERKAVVNLLRNLGRDDLLGRLPRPWPRRLDRSFAAVSAVFDTLALEEGGDVWLEKTPRHHLHAGMIPRLFADARVIHIVRDGRAVVASIRDRALKYPDRFARQTSPRYGIRAWNRAIRSHLSVAGQPRHHLVAYEDLVDDPEAMLRALCDRLGLAFEPAMLAEDRDGGHVRAAEAWKADSGGAIRAPTSKFEQLFSDTERRRIERRLDLAGHERLLQKRILPAQ